MLRVLHPGARSKRPRSRPLLDDVADDDMCVTRTAPRAAYAPVPDEMNVNHPERVRSFARSAKTDPQFAG
jgi:hypothetical protein